MAYIEREKVCEICNNKGVDCGKEKCPVYKVPTADVASRAELARLQGILLQFTDIVHKWGAKNNIDTSEISLVPILQEEADSIIKNANQEYAMEIFSEIEKWLPIIDYPIVAELKKKYTEDTPDGKRTDR